MNDISCCSAPVTVIIPTYNDAHFLKDAVLSVLNQTYKGPVELIVVNDASTDHTDQVMAELLREHPSIVYTPNLRKKGICGARNTGMDMARGEYITFLDADDVWFPNFIERGVADLVTNPEIDLVFFNFSVIEYISRRCIGDWFSERKFMKKSKCAPFPMSICFCLKTIFSIVSSKNRLSTFRLSSVIAES